MIILGICGIIAEFNPLHNGHKYLIERAKSDGNTVVSVISGNFVQRGDTAIIPKFVRAKMAIECGVDLVAELPTPWAMSTAQNFAFGAISQLLAFDIDSLYFGSESGDINKLTAVSDVLLSDEFKTEITRALPSGETYAKCRSRIISESFRLDSSVLDSPNDTLAIEYMCAARKLGANLKFVPVRRIGAGHNDCVSVDEFSNATIIRSVIKSDNFDDVLRYIPNECREVLLTSPISDLQRLDTAIISRLKLIDRSDFAKLPDVSEGLDNLLINKLKITTNYNDLLNTMKSKRYTLARIRRMVLSAFLGIDNRYFGVEPPYVRVLGFRKDSFDFSNIKSNKPIITKVSQIQNLDKSAHVLFEKENQINEIYALSLDCPERFVNECIEKLIVK